MTRNRICRFQKLATHGQLVQVGTAIEDGHEGIWGIVFGPRDLFIIDVHGQTSKVRELGKTPEHGRTEIASIKTDVECRHLGHRVEELFEVTVAHPGGSVVKDQGERMNQRTKLADELERPLVSVHKIKGCYMVTVTT